ncbi:MAG: aminopeptidase [Candidatus Hadarchaeota archaeon]
MSEMSKNEMKNIAARFVKHSMKIGKKGGRYEAVRIVYNRTDPSCEMFAQKVEEECWKAGAHTLFFGYSSERQRMGYLLKPDASLKEMGPFAEAVARRADASIFIGEEDDPNWARGLASKVKLAASVRLKIRDIMDRRKTRWALFGWPVPGAANAYGIPVGRFRKIFFRSIRQTFGRELSRLCRIYSEALTGGDIVRIVDDDGTDLSFSIRGRPVLKDDGVISEEDIRRGDVGLNIPAGEVFMAPIETSANGKIKFEKVSIPGFGKLEGLEIDFKNGKLEDYCAEAGEKNLTNFLNANVGEKDRIAEFGIGTNKGAEYTGGSIIIDEKIFGTIHIAIGNNRGAYHGRNRASSHLDMIKNMARGEVIVDGKTIMEKGKPRKG